MSAFERLQSYKAPSGVLGMKKQSSSSNEVFNIREPEGAFLDRVHKEGYSLYEFRYFLKDEEVSFNTGLSLNEFNTLSDDEKSKYERKLCYTELYNVLTSHGDTMINAIAGAGKTSALVFKIMYDIVTGEAMTLKAIPNGTQVRVVNKMWVCTFLRSGAAELENALTKWQRALGYTQTSNQISFSTLDAEFKRCLNAMGVATPIGDAGKLHSLLCKAIDSCNVTRSGEKLTKEDYQIISSIITYCRGRLDGQWNHPSCAEYSLTPTVLKLVIKQFADLRQANNIMDFDEIQELLYKYLYVTPNKAVQDMVANRYNFIYVDEFQDTSQMQYAILKFYARGRLWMNKSGKAPVENHPLFTGEENTGKIIVVGDVSQCIYSFKGSDSKILGELFDADFRPINCALSVNWRCPRNILEPVIPSIHLNKTSEKQVIIPNKEGGEFYPYLFTSFKAMLNQLRDDIRTDMNDNMKVAILCRTNFDGIIPALALEAEHVFDFGISGENMTLNSPLPRKLIGVTSLFTERSTPTVKNTLTMLAPYGAGYEIKEVIDVLKTNNMSIWQLPDADLSYSAPNLSVIIKKIKDLFVKDGVRDKKLEVEALKFIYTYLMTSTFKGTSAYCESARAYIETLLYILDSNNFESVYEFIEEVELLSDKLQARVRKNKATIQIATVHEFKGKERDSIIIWNDSKGVFPSSKCNLNDTEQLEEERRVHYIACTRAKKRERIYALNGKMGMFALEMDANFTIPSYASSVSLKKGV